MNTVVTSKEAILEVCRELIRTQGWSAVNIRTVASACGVSVGSIYNYYQSKAELISAAVESVWCDIFHFPDGQETFDSISGCIAWIFQCMEDGEKKYPGFFTLHSISFVGVETSNGRHLMEQSWKHIKYGLYHVLKHDPQVRPGVFDETFTEMEFVEIIFSLILSALLQHKYDASGIQAMVRRVIY